MATGKVEDYLQFKEFSKGMEKTSLENDQGKFKGDKPDAGLGKCDSYCT